MSLSCVLGCMSALAEGTESAGKEKGDAQGEDGHAADVDGGEHDEDLPAELSDERRGGVGDDEVWNGAKNVSVSRNCDRCVTY